MLLNEITLKTVVHVLFIDVPAIDHLIFDLTFLSDLIIPQVVQIFIALLQLHRHRLQVVVRRQGGPLNVSLSAQLYIQLVAVRLLITVEARVRVGVMEQGPLLFADDRVLLGLISD